VYILWHIVHEVNTQILEQMGCEISRWAETDIGSCLKAETQSTTDSN